MKLPIEGKGPPAADTEDVTHHSVRSPAMTLSQLRHLLESLRASAPEKDAEQLDILLNQVRIQRDDARTPRELVGVLRRGLGGIWLSTRELHQQVHDGIESFGQAVEELGDVATDE